VGEGFRGNAQLFLEGSQVPCTILASPWSSWEKGQFNPLGPTFLLKKRKRIVSKRRLKQALGSFLLPGGCREDDSVCRNVGLISGTFTPHLTTWVSQPASHLNASAAEPWAGCPMARGICGIKPCCTWDLTLTPGEAVSALCRQIPLWANGI